MDNKQSYGITNQASDLSDENLSPMKSSAIIRARDRRFSRRNKSIDENNEIIKNKLRVTNTSQLGQSQKSDQKSDEKSNPDQPRSHENLSQFDNNSQVKELQQEEFKTEKSEFEIEDNNNANITYFSKKNNNKSQIDDQIQIAHDTIPDDSMNISKSTFGLNQNVTKNSNSTKDLLNRDSLQGMRGQRKNDAERFGTAVSLDQPEDESNLVPEKSTGRAKTLACFIIGIPFLIILGVVCYILFSRKEEQELFSLPCRGINRDADNECRCLANYYQKGVEADCVGPYEDDFTPEEIQVSLAGQEHNFVTRTFKKRQMEYYSYNIDNEQQNIVDGQLVKNVTTIQHNLGVVTKNVTETYFDILVFITNSTITQGNDTIFVDGYPGVMPNNTDNNNDEVQQDQEQENYDELLNDWQKKVILEEGISKERFILSSLPIVEAKIAKNGDILNMVYPINLRADIKEIFPSILNQYSPPLDTQKYNEVHSIDGNTRRMRRVLQQNENAHQNNKQQGYFQQETPKFSADVDEKTNHASLKKQYQAESSNTQGKEIEQKTNFDQDTKIEQGRVQESKVSAEMTLNNPDRTKSELENLDGVTKDAQSGLDSKNLMEGMKITQNTNFQFKGKETLSQNFTDTISVHLEVGHLKSSTYEQFQAILIEEKKFKNDQNLKNQGNMTIGEQDQEFEILSDKEQAEKKRLLSVSEENDNSDDDGETVVVPKGEEKARELIKRIKVQLFKFSLLGIDVKGFQEFWCNHGPKGSKKDWCFLRPTFYLGKFSLTEKEFKFQVALAKIVRKFNYYRAKILDTIENVALVLKNNVGYIAGNATEVIDGVTGVLNVEENGIAQDFRIVRASYQKVLNSTYGNFTFSFNDMLDIAQKKFAGPVEKIKNDVQKFASKLYNKLEFMWDNMEESYTEILDIVKQEIQNKKNTTVVTCEVLNDIQEEFRDFTSQYMLDYKTIMYNILDDKVFQPISGFFQSLDFLPDAQVNAFSKIINTMVTNFIQGKINELLEDTNIQHEVYLQGLQSKVKSAVDMVDSGMSSVINLCEEKIDQNLPHDTDEENFLDEIITILDLDQYISADELSLSPSGLKDMAANAVKKEFLEYFQGLFFGEKDNQALMKDTLEGFNLDLENNMAQGVLDFTTNIAKMSIKVGNQVVETVDQISGGVKGLMHTVRTLVPKLRQAVKDGNKEEGELDEALDIESIKDQIERIFELKETINQIVAVYESAKEVPDSFRAMKDFVDDIVNTPFHSLEGKSMNLTSSRIDFDDEDLNGALMKKFTDSKKQEIQGTVDSKLKKDIEVSHISSFNSNINSSQVSLIDDLKTDLFDQLEDLDELFIEQLKEIIDNFEMEKRRILDVTMFELKFEKEFLYPTPIGIPLFIFFKIGAEALLGLDLGVKGRSVDLGAEIGVKVTAEAQGGVSVLIAKVGAYVEAVLFHGAVYIGLMLGFTKKFFGSVSLKAILHPFSITLGLFASHRTVKLKTKCVGVGCARICIPLPVFEWSKKYDLIDPWTYDITETFEKDLYSYSW